MNRYSFAQRPGLERLTGTNAALACNSAKLPNVYGIYHPSTGEMEQVEDTCARVAYTRDAREGLCTWTARIDRELEVEIRIEAADTSAQISWKVLREPEDAHLVTLRLEGLVSAQTTDPHARMALPGRGGSWMDPAHTADGATDHRYNWILDSFGSCAFVYTRTLATAVQCLSMDDMITSRVGAFEEGRYAQLGVLLRHRYTHLDASYRRAKPNREPGEGEDTLYPISTDFTVEEGRVRLDLVDCEPLAEESGWVPAARLIHDRLPQKRTDYYKGKMVYKILAGTPVLGVRTTWTQMREILQQVNARTGGMGQLAYIVGFQHRGHDDKYPDVMTLNAGAGTEEELRRLVEDAPAMNATVSFHDNYDDAYMESEAFDADVIARDSQGHLLRGGVWNGAQAYWISLPQYAGEAAQKRIDSTFARYPWLKDTYHLDVLTASVFRLDFRADAPAGRQQDLEARLKLVNQFAQKGYDVSSEACGLPFIGTISYFWHMQRVPRMLYEGAHRVPIVTFLAHGMADYGGSHTEHAWEILDGLLYGGFYANDVQADTPIKNLTDAAFMLFAPLDQLRNDVPVTYKEENGWKKIGYRSGARVEVNYETQECRVDIGGRRYIENGTAMIPQEDGSTLVYAAWEEPYSPVTMACTLAEGTQVTATPVGVEEEERTLTVEKEGLVLDIPVGVAYRIRV